MLGTDGFGATALRVIVLRKTGRSISTPSAVLLPHFCTINQRAKRTGLSSKALFKLSNVYARTRTMLLPRECPAAARKLYS